MFPAPFFFFFFLLFLVLTIVQVEKLRQAGMDLLEIAHKSSEAIAARARAILADLLDVISKLNSRVSDELGGDLMN